LVLDGTFGAGGYSRALLSSGAKVIAFDRDPSAAQFAHDLPGGDFTLVCDRFSNMGVHVTSADGIVLDIVGAIVIIIGLSLLAPFVSG